jgi:hypothetical protein
MKKYILFILIITALNSCDKTSSLSNGNTIDSGGLTAPVGIGGSLAKFTIVGNYLYTIDGSSLNVFDIATPSNPVFKQKVTSNLTNIEAIFPFKDKLFIAASSAMYIFNISNPEYPVQESFVPHFTGCDPVVANDNFAFLTVRGGNRCNAFANVLNVYNIQDIKNPNLIFSKNMNNPFGLGLKDNTLFVCDNGRGLVVFDVSQASSPVEKQVIADENFVDVIPNNNTLVCMLTDGIAYYDISNIQNITKLSTIKN